MFACGAFFLIMIRDCFACRHAEFSRALIRHAMDYAATVANKLHLYTDNLQLHYASLGWRVENTLEVDGRPTAIMS